MQPLLSPSKSFQLDGNPVLSAADLPSDQTGRLEDADVAGHPGEGHGDGAGKIADAGIASLQREQECAPSGVGESGVSPVENLIFNQLVER